MPEQEPATPIGFERPVQESFNPGRDRRLNFQDRLDAITTPFGQQIRDDFRQRFGNAFTSFQSSAGQMARQAEGLNVSEQLRPNKTNLMSEIQSGLASRLQREGEGQRGMTHLQREFEQRRGRGAQDPSQMQGLIGQGNEATFARLLGGAERDRNISLTAAYFQFQQTDVLASALENTPNVDITTQAFDLYTTGNNLEKRSNILAPNELAIEAGGDAVKGLAFPNASFHPKGAARRFEQDGEEFILATVGTQNVTTGLRGQNVENTVVFQGKTNNTEDPFVQVAWQIKSRLAEINQKVGTFMSAGGPREERPIQDRDQLRQEIGNLQRPDEQVVINERFLQRMEKTLEKIKREQTKESTKGTTVYLSFGEMKALFQEGADQTISRIQSHLDELTRRESNVQVKILTRLGDTAGDGQGKGSFENIQQTRLYQNLARQNAFIDVPAGFYHDKSFAVVKEHGQAEDELLAFGTGSAQITQKSLQENVELGVFFRGTQLHDDDEKGRFEQSVLNKLQQGTVPVSERYKELAVEGTSPHKFLSEGLSTVSPEGIARLEQELNELKNQYGGDRIAVSRQYNPSISDVSQQLVALKVTVKDSVTDKDSINGESSTLRLTVKKGGQVDEQGNQGDIVTVTDRDISLSGAVYVNRSGQPLKLRREGGAVQDLQPEAAAKLSSVETAKSIVGTMARTLDYQSRFKAVDASYEQLSPEALQEAGERLLTRELNEAFIQQGDREPVETLEAGLRKLQRDYSEETQADAVINTLINRLISPGADEATQQAQLASLEPIIEKLSGTYRDEDLGKLAAKAGYTVSLQAEEKAGRFAPLQHLKYRLVQESEQGQMQYRLLNKDLAKNLEERVFDPFFRSGESGVSGMQALARMPVFGVEKEEIADIERSTTFGVGQSDPASHAFLNPLSIRHGDLIATEGRPFGGEFFRAISSVSYERPTGTQSLGGLRSVKTLEDDEDRGAAPFYDMDLLTRGMDHLSQITYGEFKRDLGALQGIAEIGDLASISKRFEQDPDQEEDEEALLFLLPFRKPAQISQRLKNMIGTRPMKEVSRTTVAKIYSGERLSEQELRDDQFNVGEIDSALPEKQFRYLQKLVKDHGRDYEAIRDRLRREMGEDPGSFNRGFVDQGRPRLIGVVLGASPMSDFSYNNPAYEAEFSYKTRKTLQFNVTEVESQHRTRREIHQKLAPGTRIFGAESTELENPQTPFFERLREQYQQYLNQEGDVSRAIERVRQGLDDDLYSRLGLDVTKAGELKFYLGRGAYQIEESGRPRLVASMDDEGYLTVSHKATQTPDGLTTVPIKFKVPAVTKKYEQGVSVVTELSKGAQEGNRFFIEIGLENISRPGTGLRPGTPNIKGPSTFLEEKYFQEVAASFNQRDNSARFLPNKVAGGSIQGKDIYGIFGPGSLKSFNFEAGAYVLEEEETRSQLSGLKGQNIAKALSLLFMEDVGESGRPIAETLKAVVPEGSPMKAYLSEVSEKIEKRIQEEQAKEPKDQAKTREEYEKRVGGKLSARSDDIENLEIAGLGLLAFAESEPKQGSNEGRLFYNAQDPAPEMTVTSSDQRSPLARVRALTERSLRGEESASKELEQRLAELLKKIQQSPYGEQIQGKLILNQTSPVVRGASLFAYLATTGQELLDPYFIGSDKAMYDVPDARMTREDTPKKEGRGALAQSIMNLENAFRDTGAETTGAEGRLELSMPVKESIESFVNFATGEQLRNIVRSDRSEEDKQAYIEQLLTATHAQMQNQLVVKQMARIAPSQSLVATGTQNVGKLEYQYMQTMTKTLSREFLREPTAQEADVRLAYAVMANIGRGKEFPEPSEMTNLESQTISEFSRDEVNDRINRIAMALPFLGQKGDENLAQSVAKRLLQVGVSETGEPLASKDKTFDNLLERAKDIKFAVRGYQEGRRDTSIEDRMRATEKAISAFNEALPKGLGPIRVGGLADEETLSQVKAYYDRTGGGDINLRRRLMTDRPDLYWQLEQSGLSSLVYDRVTGQPTSAMNDELTLQRRWREEYASLREGIEQATDISETSQVLNAMRSLRAAAIEAGQGKVAQEIGKTRELVIPRIDLDEGKAQLAHPGENEPVRLLMPGLDVLDNLKLEYPGFDDPLLQKVVEARTLNYQLADIDTRVADSQGGIELTPEQTSLIKRRESLAFELRQEASKIASTSVAERSAGDYAEIPGTSYPAIRSFMVGYHETVFGSRLEDVERGKVRQSEPDKRRPFTRKMGEIISGLIQEKKLALAPLQEEENRLNEQFEAIQEELNRVEDPQAYDKYREQRRRVGKLEGRIVSIKSRYKRERQEINRQLTEALQRRDDATDALFNIKQRLVGQFGPETGRQVIQLDRPYTYPDNAPKGVSPRQESPVRGLLPPAEAEPPQTLSTQTYASIIPPSEASPIITPAPSIQPESRRLPPAPQAMSRTPEQAEGGLSGLSSPSRQLPAFSGQTYRTQPLPESDWVQAQFQPELRIGPWRLPVMKGDVYKNLVESADRQQARSQGRTVAQLPRYKRQKVAEFFNQARMLALPDQSASGLMPVNEGEQELIDRRLKETFLGEDINRISQTLSPSNIGQTQETMNKAIQTQQAMTEAMLQAPVDSLGNIEDVMRSIFGEESDELARFQENRRQLENVRNQFLEADREGLASRTIDTLRSVQSYEEQTRTRIVQQYSPSGAQLADIESTAQQVQQGQTGFDRLVEQVSQFQRELSEATRSDRERREIRLGFSRTLSLVERAQASLQQEQRSDDPAEKHLAIKQRQDLLPKLEREFGRLQNVLQSPGPQRGGESEWQSETDTEPARIRQQGQQQSYADGWLRNLYEQYLQTPQGTLDSKASPLSELLMRGLQGDTRVSLSEGMIPARLRDKINEIDRAEQGMRDALESQYGQPVDISDEETLSRIERKLLYTRDRTAQRGESVQRLDREFNRRVIERTLSRLGQRVEDNNPLEWSRPFEDIEAVKTEVRTSYRQQAGWYREQLSQQLGVNRRRVEVGDPNEEIVDLIAGQIQQEYSQSRREVEQRRQRVEQLRRESQANKQRRDRRLESLYRKQQEEIAKQKQYRADLEKAAGSVEAYKQKLQQLKAVKQSQQRNKRERKTINMFYSFIDRVKGSVKEVNQARDGNVYETAERELAKLSTSVISDQDKAQILQEIEEEGSRPLMPQETMIYRGGAPHSINSMLQESQKIGKVTPVETFNKRADQSNSLFKLDHQRAKTAMIMPGFGAYFSQQGDFDGDTYMAMLSKSRRVSEEKQRLDKQYVEKQRDLQRARKQRDIASQSEDDVEAQYQDRLIRNLEAELNELETERNEKEEEVAQLQATQQRRAQQRYQDLQKSIRTWQQGYTGLPGFLFQEVDEEGNVNPATLGSEAQAFQQAAQEEVFTSHQLSTWMNSMRSINEQIMQAREGSADVVKALEAYRQASRHKPEGGSITLGEVQAQLDDSEPIKKRLGELFESEGLSRPIDKQELSESVAKLANTRTAVGDFAKLQSNAGGTVNDETQQEAMQGIIGISGSQILGEAYNAFVPMMHFASAQMAFRWSLQESEEEKARREEVGGVSPYEDFRQKFTAKLANLQGEPVEGKELQDQVNRILKPNQEGLMEDLEEYYRSVFQIVSNVQIIARDDALKPKEEGSFQETADSKIERGDIPVTAETRSDNIARRSEMARIAYSELGTKLDLDKATNYRSGTLGVQHLAYLYTNRDTGNLQDTLKRHSEPYLTDVVNIYNQKRGYSKGQGLSASEIAGDPQATLQAFEESLVEMTARTQASFQVESNLPSDDQAEMDSIVRRMLAKSQSVLATEEAGSKKYQEAQQIVRSVEGRLGREATRSGGDLEQALDRYSGKSRTKVTKGIIGDVIYSQLTEGPRRNLMEETFRKTRELSVSAQKLKESTEPDKALADAGQDAMSLLAIQATTQRGHLEEMQQHHQMSYTALQQLESWRKTVGDPSKFFDIETASLSETQRNQLAARSNIVMGLVGGFGLSGSQGDNMSDEEKIAFTQALFEGYDPKDPQRDTSLFTRMLAQQEGIEQQLRHIDALVKIEGELDASKDKSRDEIQRLEKEYSNHLKALRPNVSQKFARKSGVNYQSAEEIGRQQMTRAYQAKEEALKPLDPYEAARKAQRRSQIREGNRQVTEAQQVAGGSEFLSSIMAPATLALFGSGMGDTMGERAGMFAYDVMQATAEMSNVGRGQTTYTMQTQKHLFGDEDMGVAARAFRMQRTRMAIESQETMLGGISAAIAQESAVRVFGKAMQSASAAVNRARGGNNQAPSRGGANLASLGTELLGDALMMAGSRMVMGSGDMPASPPGQMPNYLMKYLTEQTERIREATRQALEAVDESGEYATYVYNEQVDFIASASPTVADKVARGVKVVDETGGDAVPVEEGDMTIGEGSGSEGEESTADVGA